MSTDQHYFTLAEDIDLQTIHDLSSRFRKAIESLLVGVDDSWLSFPAGCCYQTCILFGCYLKSRFQIDISMICCIKRFDGYLEPGHCWLETKSGIVIDLTGDQFGMHFPPVMVSPNRESLHQEFSFCAQTEEVSEALSIHELEKQYQGWYQKLSNSSILLEPR